MSNKNQNFNGGYIKASQEAYDLLVAHGYKYKSMATWMLEQYFIIVDDEIYLKTKDFKHSDPMPNQFYINNGALSWDEPIKQICDNPDVNALYISNMNDLNNLPIPSDELTLKEILQDVQDKQMSVDASELLIKARFKISEE